MERTELKTIAQWCGGELKGHSIPIDGICTDSRRQAVNELFIPIRGNNFDGHDFVDEALSNGCSAFLSEKALQYPAPFISVNNTLKAFHDIAHEYSSNLNVFNIAITGSTGKTSLKDFIYGGIESENKYKTSGNTNNLIGVPQNLVNLSSSTEYAVIEAGMNSIGELSSISAMIRPDAVIITCINNSHIGMFDDFRSLIQAKMEILEYARNDSVLLINGDNRDIAEYIPDSIHYRTFGIQQWNDYAVSSFKINTHSVTVQMGSNTYILNMPGMGAVYIIAAAYAFMNELQCIPFSMNKACNEFESSNGRMHIYEYRNITIIDDSYNASPASMKNALDVLSEFKGRKIAVLGDMLELGSDSARFHKDISLYALNDNIDVILAVGDAAAYYIRDYRDRHFISAEELSRHLAGLLKKGDTVLFKGSRGMRIEEIIKSIKEG